MITLDSGGVSALTHDKSLIAELTIRGWWPPRVPSVVLIESLTGDHRRDHAVNRLLRICTVADVPEQAARTAAALRYRTGRAATISAVDATVAAMAVLASSPGVVTSDPRDCAALLAAAEVTMAIVAV